MEDTPLRKNMKAAVKIIQNRRIKPRNDQEIAERLPSHLAAEFWAWKKEGKP